MAEISSTTSVSSGSAINIGDLQNKVAFITGASSGIGREIAVKFAAAGAYIVAADLTPNPPSTPLLAELLKDTDLTTPTVDLVTTRFPTPANSLPRAIYVNCDVTSSSSIADAIAKTVSVYSRLDILATCAGIAAEGRLDSTKPPGPYCRSHELPDATFDTDIAVNLRGVWLCCKHALTQMLAQSPYQHPNQPTRTQIDGSRGWIINIGSVYSLVGGYGATAYCATKGGVTQLTKALALEYAQDKIHVNCIAPGYVETSLTEQLKRNLGATETTDRLTSLHPWGRLALPEEIAKMAVFLAGDGASFITGATIPVDGGFTAQ